MKMTFKRLDLNVKKDSLEVIVNTILREYLPNEIAFVLKDIHRIYGFTYAVTLYIDSHEIIENALFEVTIPVDMRKRIEVAPYYRSYDTHTAIVREIDEEYVHIYIKEYQCIDTDEGTRDILIGSDKLSFKIKDDHSVQGDYYSLYVDESGIIRIDNREEIRKGITYINPDIKFGEELSLRPGYIRKCTYCKGSIDYAKHNRISIHALIHNIQSTKYCYHRVDTLFLPVKYMDRVRELLDIRRWG